MNVNILIIASTIVVLLNIWVWFFPRLFIDYLKWARRSNDVELLNIQKVLWSFIGSPNYIWMPRFIFTIALIIMAILILTLDEI
jgi:hypothetical protein